MPMVDYRTWYQQEQERRKNLGLKTGVGGLSENQMYQPYKPSYGEIGKNIGRYALDAGSKALMGVIATGGNPLGALAAVPTVIEEYPKLFKRAKTSFEQGDWKQGTSQLNVISLGTNALWDKTGLPDWTNPNYAFGKTMNAVFHKPRTKIEEQRWKKLREAGFEVPKWVDDKSLKSDIYREDLGENFVGTTPEGNFVNNIFARSRNEADLRPEDLVQRATNYEMFGNTWKNASDETKRQVMQSVLDSNAVREYKGTVDINWTPELLQQAQSALGDNLAEQPQNQERKYWVKPKYEWGTRGA